MKRVIVVPAFQREMEIGTLVILLRKLGGEVVVIDNGSDDETARIARDLRAGVVRIKERQGWRYLLKRIKRLVQEGGYREVVIYDPKDRVEVKELKKALMKRDLKDVTLLKTKGEVEEEGNPFHIRTWIMKRETLLKMRLRGFRLSPEREITHYVKKYSIPFEVLEVDRIVYRKRKVRVKGGFTIGGVGRGIKNFIKNHPLSFWGGLGVVTLFVGLAFGVLTVDYFYREHRLNYYYSFLSFATVFLAGVLMFTGLVLNAFATLKEKVDILLKGV
ncbi:MAG: glycosyltransferase [Thermoplasmata archaeon]|nr:glycosyltransferase [Thermoplasmata archaeon]